MAALAGPASGLVGVVSRSSECSQAHAGFACADNALHGIYSELPG
ncbi:hypothetical protein C8R32_10897 [Nitrosospira sp. Nsp5]|uniref:Uncharacterized protein n=1 Tax=Nitrosospira multiformis TaxID=1231 RepID=A0ABY0TBQ3_9PROT|nr:hypothetical protein C8R32_10897 [Nitrosospira sp. Nsp5]SDQ34356.1 hypothetical protein SAMN05216402_0474 [Nitrosospira multiformis]